MKAVLRRAVGLLLVLALAACGLIALREESAAYSFSTVLIGRISGQVAPGKAVVVAAPAQGSLAVESITLSGPGVRRTLAPAPQFDAFARYLDGVDHAEGAYFSFVGLAQGNYELTIRAPGYRPHAERHHVVPGRYSYIKPIALTPLP